MKFVSSGHCDVKGPNYDPGASGVNKRTEGHETVRIRNKVLEILKERGYTDFIKDGDSESLKQYLARIRPGDGSVVVEFHFNAFNGKATGTEVVVSDNSDRLDRAFAQELADATGCILNLTKRSGGVITESQTHRGRLGIMRETGIVALVEVCFIDNPEDMKKFDTHFDTLCSAYADIIIKYDNLIK